MERRVDSMKRTLLAVGFTLAVLLMVPYGTAAPDMPPDAIWTVTVPTTDCPGRAVEDIATDDDGNVYVLSYCGSRTPRAYQLNKLRAVDGVLLWTDIRTSVSGAGLKSTEGTFGDIFTVAITPNGDPVVWYLDQGLSTTQKQLFRVYDNQTGVTRFSIGQSTSYFSFYRSSMLTDNYDAITFRVVNETIFQYHLGGKGDQLQSGYRVGIQCDALETSSCFQLYEVSCCGQSHGNFMAWYNDPALAERMYVNQLNCNDSDAEMRHYNSQTGTQGSIHHCVSTADALASRYWRRTDNTFTIAQSDNVGANDWQVGWLNLAADNSAITATVVPTEAKIHDGVNPLVTNPKFGYLDGADNLFVCGYYGASDEHFLAKYDTDGTPEMRWNITFPGAGGLHVRCDIDQNGDLVYMWGTTGVRKYSAGATPRPADEDGSVTFTGYHDVPAPGAVVPTTAPPGFIGRSVSNCEDAFGVDCGIFLGIAIVGMTVFAFARVSRTPLIMGIAVILAVIAAVALNLFAEWVILLVGFAVIALAGGRMFGGAEDNA